MNRAQFVTFGVIAAVLLVGLTYGVTSSLVTGQMMPLSQEIKPEAWDRLAAALERIATTMEKPANNSGMMGGMMQGMGPMQGMMGHMGQGMMSQGMMGGQSMMNPMQQMHGMMHEMSQMMKQMQEHMGHMMSGMMGQGSGMSRSAPITPAEDAWTRTSNEGAVEVKVIYMNPLLKPEESAGKLIFKVALDTHSVDLAKLDLTKLATLRTNTGLSVSEGLTWEAVSQESNHHRTGLLKIADTMDGKLIVTGETQSLELELKEIVVPIRLFSWQLQK
jgi:hypothetical protein